MFGDGSTSTIEEQITALITQMTGNAEKLWALEAENVAIRATNGELRALIDGVAPDNVMLERPIPAPNGEQKVNRIAPIAPVDPMRPGMNHNVGQNQQTPQTARVEINLNNLPIGNEIPNGKDPAMDLQPENALRTPVSLQSTLGLVKPGSDLHLFADPKLSCRFTEMEALIQRILGVPAPTRKAHRTASLTHPSLTQLPSSRCLENSAYVRSMICIGLIPL